MAGVERIIFEAKSGTHPLVITEDADGLRTLRFGRTGPRQSVVKLLDPSWLELPYTRIIPVSLAGTAQVRRILILGLGGGTLPRFYRWHEPGAVVDVVEIVPEVVEAAAEFMEIRAGSMLNILVEDGRQFVRRTPHKYDIVCLDCFGLDGIPYHLATTEFMRELQRIVSDGGVVVGNLWSGSENPLYAQMVAGLLEVFRRALLIGVPGAGNRIWLVRPDGTEWNLNTLSTKAAELTQRIGLQTDLGSLVRNWSRVLNHGDLSEPPLRDRPGIEV